MFRSFPLTAHNSPAATPTRNSRAGTYDLRISHAAADTVFDALKRSILSSTGGGAGLRGGTFRGRSGQRWLTISLVNAHWTNDVSVSGRAQWSPTTGTLRAELHIQGPNEHDGTLRMNGHWLIHATRQPLEITGTLNGRHVSGTVAAT